MCGIIGIVGKSSVSDRLVDGLKRMEYRGYDSSGVCTVRDGQLIRRRAEGKLANLVNVLKSDDAAGNIGIAHTRWATHGAPTTSNAHPHATGEVALVHNGIIENFKQLRDELTARGRTFESETDTEVVAHLVSRTGRGWAFSCRGGQGCAPPLARSLCAGDCVSRISRFPDRCAARRRPWSWVTVTAKPIWGQTRWRSRR